jgi:hypothetical protein
LGRARAIFLIVTNPFEGSSGFRSIRRKGSQQAPLTHSGDFEDRLIVLRQALIELSAQMQWICALHFEAQTRIAVYA